MQPTYPTEMKSPARLLQCLQSPCIQVGVYSVTKKSPPEDLWQFFQNGLEFFNQILHAYYAFLSTLDYEFLFSYLQLWRSCAIFSVTTQFTSCAQNVHHRPKLTLAFSDIFPKQLGIFSPNITRLLNVHMYVRMQIFIQLSPTVTRLCHIKCDHPARAFRPMLDILSISLMMWTGWSRLIWHNFIKVAGNWKNVV